MWEKGAFSYLRISSFSPSTNPLLPSSSLSEASFLLPPPPPPSSSFLWSHFAFHSEVASLFFPFFVSPCTPWLPRRKRRGKPADRKKSETRHSTPLFSQNKKKERKVIYNVSKPKVWNKSYFVQWFARKNRKFFLACRQKSQNWKIVAAAMPFIYTYPDFPQTLRVLRKKEIFLCPWPFSSFRDSCTAAVTRKKKSVRANFPKKGKKVLENVYGNKGEEMEAWGLERDSVNIGYCILRK